MPSDRNLDHLYPDFREKVEAVLADMNAYAAKHMIGYTWKLVEGFRTAQYQHDLWEQGRERKGRIVTYKDGYKNKSNHQSGMAADILPFHGHDFDWDGKPEWWAYLGHCARAHGLDWGGDWKNFKDLDHIEWPTKDKMAYTTAAAWLRAKGLA